MKYTLDFHPKLFSELRNYDRSKFAADGVGNGRDALDYALSGEYDGIVLDVLRSMPRWKPGTVDGQPVSVRYTLPVTFGKNK